jgi:hypothetical protein
MSRPKSSTKAEQRDRVNRETESSELRSNSGDRVTDATHATQDSARPASVQTLNDAAHAAIAHGMGNCLFVLARAVKAFEATTKTKLPKAELPDAFSLWWNLAKPQLPKDADYDEYLFLFMDAYDRVKHPLGSNVIEIATARAKRLPLPEAAQSFTSPKIKLLVAVCYHLQQLAGDSPFFLSVRTAAKLVDVRLETANAFLRGLCHQGVLIVETKGTASGCRATRFRMPMPEKKEQSP